MKRHVTAIAIVLATAHAVAQQPVQSQADHSAHHPNATAPAASKADFADGEVRRIDKAASKITLKHGEIKSLDMPPMSMVFVVSDAALLDNVKPGDKVRFRAINRTGQLTVTEIEVAN